MKNRLWTFQKIIFKSVLWFFVISVGLVLVFRFVPVPLTPLMLIRSAQSLGERQWVGIDKDWVSLDEISAAVPSSMIAAEDSKFYEHNGFDYEAIEKAIEYNKTHKRKKGASTITQQTAKNVFLWPSRDWVRKGFEAYFTVLMELLWTKERIMEVYLNVVEVGPGVYGVEAAAQKYFRRSAKNLNSYQAAMIAAVLPNPHRLRLERPSNYVVRRQHRIILNRFR
jgi:monofunctional biosynthetic peptidoglycan transglycosylase